jgi:translation elongation factor EF-G
MSNTDLDAYKAKHELIMCKKILVNKVLNNVHVKATPALVEKIKKISLELEECMTAVNTLLYSQDKLVNSSIIALDQFGDHYWRIKPEGATHIIRDLAENTVYWCRSSKSQALHIRDIQSIWSLSSWSTHHHMLTKVGSGLDIVKYPSIDKIAIRHDGKVYSLPCLLNTSQFMTVYTNRV